MENDLLAQANQAIPAHNACASFGAYYPYVSGMKNQAYFYSGKNVLTGSLY